MRIQETDRVLKEAKVARRAAHVEPVSSNWTRWLTGTVVAALVASGLFAFLNRKN